MINNNKDLNAIITYPNVDSTSAIEKPSSTQTVALPVLQLQLQQHSPTETPALDVNAELIHPVAQKNFVEKVVFETCKAFISQKEYEKAQKILSSFPLSPQLLILHIEILGALKQWDQIIVEIEKNMHLVEKEPRSLLVAVAAFLQTNQLEKADELARKAYKHVDLHNEGLFKLLSCQIALIGLRRHRYSESIKILEPLLDSLKSPEDDNTLLILAECYLHTNQKFKLIIDKILKNDSPTVILKNDLSNWSVGYLIACDLFEERDFKAALRFCDHFLMRQMSDTHACQKSPPPKCIELFSLSRFVLCLKAEIILVGYDENRLKVAMQICEGVLVASPDFVNALNLKAKILIQKKIDDPLILNLLNKSKEIDKDNPSTLSLLGSYYLDIKNDWKTAKKYFQESLKILPDYRQTLAALFNYNAFVCKDLPAAEKLAQQLINTRPYSCEGWQYLAEVYWKRCQKGNMRDVYSEKLLDCIKEGLVLVQEDQDRHHFLNLKMEFHLSFYNASRMETLLNECCELIENYSDQSSTYNHLVSVVIHLIEHKEHQKLIQLTTKALEKKIIPKSDINGQTSFISLHGIRASAYFYLNQFDKAQLDFDQVWLEIKGDSLPPKCMFSLKSYLETLEINKDLTKASQVCQYFLDHFQQSPEEKKLYRNKLKIYQQEIKKELKSAKRKEGEKPLIDLTCLQMANQPLAPKVLPKSIPKVDITKTKQEVEKFTKAQEANEVARLKEIKEAEAQQKQEKAELAKKKQETKTTKNLLKQQEIQQKLQQKNEQRKTKYQSTSEKPSLAPSASVPVQAPSLSLETTEEAIEIDEDSSPVEVQENLHSLQLSSSSTASSNSQWQLDPLHSGFAYRKSDLEEPLLIAKKKPGIPKTRLPRIKGTPVEAQLEVAGQILIYIEDILKRSNKLTVEPNLDSIPIQDKLALMYYMLRLTETLSQLVETESFKEINQAFKTYIVDIDWMRQLRNDLRSHFLFIPQMSLYNTARALIKSSLSHNIKSWLSKKKEIESLLPVVSPLDIPPLCQAIDRQVFKCLLVNDPDFISTCLFEEMKKDLQTISQLVHIKDDFAIFWKEGDAEQTACKMLISNLRKYLVIFKSYGQLKYFTPTNKEEASLKKCLTYLIQLGNIIGHEIGSDDYLDYVDEILISQLFEIAKLAKPISEFVQHVKETHFTHLKPLNFSLTFSELAHHRYQKFCL